MNVCWLPFVKTCMRISSGVAMTVTWRGGVAGVRTRKIDRREVHLPFFFSASLTYVIYLSFFVFNMWCKYQANTFNQCNPLHQTNMGDIGSNNFFYVHPVFVYLVCCSYELFFSGQHKALQVDRLA